MLLSPRVLGVGPVRDLTARVTAPVLQIGTDRFTRAQLARVGCFNFIAAANLSRALALFDIPVKHTRDLFETVSPRDLVVPHVGAVAVAVLAAAFEVAGLGGDNPLEAWVGRHRPQAATREFLTFDTLKHQEAQRLASASRDRGRRRGATPPSHRYIRRYRSVKERDHAIRHANRPEPD